MNRVRALATLGAVVAMMAAAGPSISEPASDLLGINTYRVPSLPRTDVMRVETAADHYSRVREMVRRESAPISFFSWMEAVSGVRPRLSGLWYNNALADELGVPAWQYHHLDPKWTGVEANDATSFNYAVTGYALLDGLREQHSWSWLNDDGIRLILRAGSAMYQRYEDVRQLRFPQLLATGRTWYFEDVNDVAPLTAGFEYGRYLGLRESLRSAGIAIDPNFGRFTEPTDRVSRPMLDYDRYFTERRDWLDEQIRRLDRP